MIEHTCRPATPETAGEPWQCLDCGGWWEPDEEEDKSVTVATIGVVAAVSVGSAAAYWGSPVLGAVLAAPGLLCGVYVLWRILRS